MTRKEEIREAALDQRSGLLPVDDAQMIELIDFILELTAPESSTHYTCPNCGSHGYKTLGEFRNLCTNCKAEYNSSDTRLIPGESPSPAPLESQEELWIEASKVFQKFYFEGIKAIECQKELESLFILTRRTEGNQVTIDSHMCKCSNEERHGETSVMCCNECGLPTEPFWSQSGKGRTEGKQEELWKEIEDDEHILWNYKQATIERLKENYLLSRRQASGAREKVSPDLEKFHDLERNDGHNI